MQSSKTALAVLLLLACQVFGQTGASAKQRRDPWCGFEAGSWIVYQEKKTVNNKSTLARVKEVLVRYENETPRLARIAEVDGKFGEPADTFSRPPGGVPADSEIIARRNETIVIDDEKIACTVIEYGFENKEKDFKGRLLLWRNGERKLPYREIPTSAGNPPALAGDVVRAEYSFQYRGSSVRYIAEVVAFAKALKVGDRDLTCALEKIAFEESGSERSISGEGLRWLSADIPGYEARFVLKGNSNGVGLEIDKTVLEFKAATRAD